MAVVVPQPGSSNRLNAHISHVQRAWHIWCRKDNLKCTKNGVCVRSRMCGCAIISSACGLNISNRRVITFYFTRSAAIWTGPPQRSHVVAQHTRAAPNAIHIITICVCTCRRFFVVFFCLCNRSFLLSALFVHFGSVCLVRLAGYGWQFLLISFNAQFSGAAGTRCDYPESSVNMRIPIMMGAAARSDGRTGSSDARAGNMVGPAAAAAACTEVLTK